MGVSVALPDVGIVCGSAPARKEGTWEKECNASELKEAEEDMGRHARRTFFCMVPFPCVWSLDISSGPTPTCAPSPPT